MCDPGTIGVIAGIVSIGTNIVGAVQQSQAQTAAGESNKEYYDELAKISESQIEPTYKTAKRQIKYNVETAVENITGLNANSARATRAVELKSRDVGAAQVAAGAASGIDAGSATAEDIARDTFNKAEMDKLAIKYTTNNKIKVLKSATEAADWELLNNAELTETNLRNQAKAYRLAGKNALTAANISAGNTLLTGGATVLNNAYSYFWK